MDFHRINLFLNCSTFKYCCLVSICRLDVYLSSVIAPLCHELNLPSTSISQLLWAVSSYIYKIYWCWSKKANEARLLWWMLFLLVRHSITVSLYYTAVGCLKISKTVYRPNDGHLTTLRNQMSFYQFCWCKFNKTTSDRKMFSAYFSLTFKT